MKKLLATCDRILAALPKALSEESVIGGIVVPKASLEAMQRHAIVELDIISVGPDCKVARVGDTVVVNKNICSPIPWDGREYMVFSEVSALAIVKDIPEVEKPQMQAKDVLSPAGAPLTMEEVRAGLGVQDAPKDDASDLPNLNAAGAQLPQTPA